MARKHVKSVREFMEEEEKARAKLLDKQAAAIAAEKAPARMELLKKEGPHRTPRRGEIARALQVYKSGQEAYRRNQKALRDKELNERQAEGGGQVWGRPGYQGEPPVDWRKDPTHRFPDPGLGPGRQQHRGEQDPAWTPRDYYIPDRSHNPTKDQIWFLDGRRISL